MEIVLGGILFLAANVLVVLGLLLGTRRQWPPHKLKATNDVAGFYSTIIGTIYAVILAFMLSRVWADFEDAQINVMREANTLVDLFRLSDGLSSPDRFRLKELTRTYAVVMIEKEWDSMGREQTSNEGQDINDRLWQAIIHIRPHDPTEQMAQDHLLTRLTDMMAYRRLRQLQSRMKIPTLLWIVLIAGGVITIGFSALFGVESFRLHALKTLALTLLISLTLVSIGELNRPFKGWVHVSPDGFVLALQTFDRLPVH
jgi:hypothetical protein